MRAKSPEPIYGTLKRTWSARLPTEPGWYWWRDTCPNRQMQGHFVVHVVRYSGSVDLSVGKFYVKGPLGESGLFTYAGEWAGPIHEAKEPSEALGMTELVAGRELDRDILSLLDVNFVESTIEFESPSRCAEDALHAAKRFGLFEYHVLAFDKNTNVWYVANLRSDIEPLPDIRLPWMFEVTFSHEDFCLCICGAIKTLHRKRTEGA